MNNQKQLEKEMFNKTCPFLKGKILTKKQATMLEKEITELHKYTKKCIEVFTNIPNDECSMECAFSSNETLQNIDMLCKEIEPELNSYKSNEDYLEYQHLYNNLQNIKNNKKFFNEQLLRIEKQECSILNKLKAYSVVNNILEEIYCMGSSITDLQYLLLLNNEYFSRINFLGYFRFAHVFTEILDQTMHTLLEKFINISIKEWGVNYGK